MICKKCGNEVDKKAVICTNCGCKIKKPIYKKWWFWVIIVIVLMALGGALGSEDSISSDNSTKESTTISQETTVSEEKKTDNKAEEISYESVDLQTMIDDLKSNALKAEKTYKNKYVEITGEISNFDSGGKYISIKTDTDAIDFTNIMCYIKKDSQRDFLMEKSTGDTVTIKGKVISVGEVLGYSISIAEVS